MRKAKRNATVAGIFLLITIVLASAGLALADGMDEPPILPDAFYGELTVNGNDSPAGVTIVAKIAGVERGRYTTQQVGAYGSPGAFTPKLIVEGTKEDKGENIHFFIMNYDGTLILASNDPTPIFKSGADVREVDLVFEGVQLEAAPASVTTESATNITASSATLNASIAYGDYENVDIAFSYREVGGSWADTGLDTVTAASYSKGITGLKKETSYEFYVYIEFDGLENKGATKSFTTAAVVPPEKATLKVDTTPVKGEVFVGGVSWGTAPQTQSVDPGTYTVSFGAVSGYTTPSAQTVTLAAGETKTVTGIYEVAVPDFDISVDPTLGSVVQGGSVATTVSITSVAGFSETVSLSASGLPSGAAASFSPPSGAPSFDSTLTISTTSTTPVGAYTVTIKGTGGGKTHSCTYTLTVTTVPVNQPPTADANGPYSVDEVETVVLDGTGSSDPDGDTLTYSWSITDDPTGQASLTGASTATPTFHAPSVDSDTNVTVKLTVDDGHGHTDSDTATVTVKDIAPPPDEFLPVVVAIIIIVILIVVICYWKREEISRRLRKA